MSSIGLGKVEYAAWVAEREAGIEAFRKMSPKDFPVALQRYGLDQCRRDIEDTGIELSFCLALKPVHGNMDEYEAFMGRRDALAKRLVRLTRVAADALEAQVLIKGWDFGGRSC